MDKGSKSIKSFFNLQKGKTDSSIDLPINSSLEPDIHHLKSENAVSVAKIEQSCQYPTEAELKCCEL